MSRWGNLDSVPVTAAADDKDPIVRLRKENPNVNHDRHRIIGAG
jgi:hypothetical protein